MNKYFISSASVTDLEGIHQLETECFPIDQLSLKQYERLHKKKSVTIFATKYNNKIIGSAIVIIWKRAEVARIYSFAVDKNFRGTSVAKDLYQHIENFCREKKCKEILLEVRTDNLAARKFYQKNGFIFFEEYKNFYQDGKDAYRMKKKLVLTSPPLTV